MKTTALITGASSGIGYEMACQLAASGCNLVLVARNRARLEEMAVGLSKKHAVEVWSIPADLSGTESALSVYKSCREKKISIDYLINNAGVGDFGLFYQCDWTKQAQMIQLNITSLTHLTRLFLPDMVGSRSGRIMQVASTASFVPGPLMSVYYATKAYVLSFGEAISNELEGTGVTVTILCPPATESNFAANASASGSSLFRNKRLPTSAEIAAYGIRCMLRGKRVGIYGWKNKLLIFSQRFGTRGMVLKISRSLQGQ